MGSSSFSFSNAGCRMARADAWASPWLPSLLLALACRLTFWVCEGGVEASRLSGARKPNVVLILTDDQDTYLGGMVTASAVGRGRRSARPTTKGLGGCKWAKRSLTSESRGDGVIALQASRVS